MNTCPITGHPIHPPHTISTTAANRLATAARTLPQLMQTVDYALTGLRNGQTSHTSHGPRSPLNETLLELIDEMRDSLNTWAAALVQHANPTIRYHNGNWDQIAAILHILTPHATTWEEAPNMVDECLYAIQRLEHLASPKPPTTWYAGKCETCGTDLTPHANTTTVTCTNCGTVNNTNTTRQVMIEKLETMPLPRSKARQAAELIAGQQISEGTVKTWVRRGKLQPDEHGRIRPKEIMKLAAKYKRNPLH